ncbi:T9SS type A sorting domain-containing protein [Saccharicrinis aurantiacus]|uniref:T9SS type A sorting domain-containing protein n=1 Tax=Saccharicrinis aurantiacus TaxID=1849719 RepID=UPI00248FF248|nr:T9SS type A sorting domain-containing protein [Saccharicrinis aurantiacus]
MMKQLLILAIGVLLTYPSNGQTLIYSKPTELLHTTNTQSFIGNGFKLDAVVQYVFNESSSAWDKPYTKQTYLYDTNGNETETRNYEWDEAKQNWKNVDKKVSSYTSSGILVTDTHYQWKDSDGWNNEKKYTYSYNSELLLKEILIWEPSSNTWEARQRVRIDYYESGQVKEEVRLIRMAPETHWERTQKKFYLYKDGQRESVGVSYWSKQTQSWNPQFLYNYLYDRTDHLLRQIICFSKSNTNWVKMNSTSYNYNINKMLAGMTVVYEDHDNKGYDEVKEQSYAHNFEVPANNLLLPYKNRNTVPSAFHHQLTTNQLYAYNKHEDDLVKYREDIYYYSAIEHATSVPFVYDELIKVSPNPASHYITIHCPNKSASLHLNLYNYTGQAIINSQYTAGKPIDISYLPRGLYIYKITQEQTTVTGKLLIR